MKESDAETPGQGRATTGGPEKPLSWYVGVPICTNPMTVMDMLVIAGVLWVGGMLFIMLGQVTIGSGLTRSSIFAAFFLGMYLAGAALAAFVFVGGFLFSNRYASLYRIGEAGIYCEHLRGRIRPIGKPFIAFAGYAVEPVLDVTRSVVKRVQWNEVKSLQIVEKMRVIVVKGKRGTLLKIHCPDATLLAKAEAAIRAHTAGETQNPVAG